MTRTERSAFPRALVKDRSESKSGLDKSIRKNGGGHHNWGSLADETYLEAAAMEDEQRDLEEAAGETTAVAKTEAVRAPSLERKTSSFTEEEQQNAKQFRQNALKGQDIDLSAIARTSSAVSTSPPNRTPISSDADTNSLKSA